MVGVCCAMRVGELADGPCLNDTGPGIDPGGHQSTTGRVGAALLRTSATGAVVLLLAFARAVAAEGVAGVGGSWK